MIKTFDYFRADPAGNITGFVLGYFPEKERPIIANAIIDQIDKTVEQVGFISKTEDGNYRMDMMGGEFCGNASRSFGLYIAKEKELKGEQVLKINVSGVDRPVEVVVNPDQMKAEIALEPAYKIDRLNLADGNYVTVFLEGIVHVIVDDRPEDEEYSKKIIEDLKKYIKEEAYGTMFVDLEKSTMVPYVYVSETDTLIREGSCGSGTISFAHYLNANMAEDFVQAIIQPGGTIEAKAEKINGKLLYKIGGKVDFGLVEKISVNTEE